MKMIRFLVCVVFLGRLFFPQAALAHLAGQPPFFKVNGEYANLYPVPLTSLSDFNLPQDLAPRNYLINQKIEMEMDVTNLPAPPEVINRTKFSWEFGDGQKGEGLKGSHAYTKSGSYVLIIFADDGSTPTPQVIESMFVNILPSADYQLPVAVIKVNGKGSKDPLTDILKAKFGDSINFDSTSSSAKSSKIVSVLWDFGDQASSKDSVTTHTYKSDLSTTFPVLRIKDENGFIADAYLEVQNGTFDQNQITDQSKNLTDKENGGLGKYWIWGIVAVVLAGGFIFLKKKKA